MNSGNPRNLCSRTSRFAITPATRNVTPVKASYPRQGKGGCSADSSLAMRTIIEREAHAYIDGIHSTRVNVLNLEMGWPQDILVFCDSVLGASSCVITDHNITARCIIS